MEEEKNNKKGKHILKDRLLNEQRDKLHSEKTADQATAGVNLQVNPIASTSGISSSQSPEDFLLPNTSKQLTITKISTSNKQENKAPILEAALCTGKNVDIFPVPQSCSQKSTKESMKGKKWKLQTQATETETKSYRSFLKSHSTKSQTEQTPKQQQHFIKEVTAASSTTNIPLNFSSQESAFYDHEKAVTDESIFPELANQLQSAFSIDKAEQYEVASSSSCLQKVNITPSTSEEYFGISHHMQRDQLSTSSSGNSDGVNLAIVSEGSQQQSHLIPRRAHAHNEPLSPPQEGEPLNLSQPALRRSQSESPRRYYKPECLSKPEVLSSPYSKISPRKKISPRQSITSPSRNVTLKTEKAKATIHPLQESKELEPLKVTQVQSQSQPIQMQLQPTPPNPCQFMYQSGLEMQQAGPSFYYNQPLNIEIPLQTMASESTQAFQLSGDQSTFQLGASSSGNVSQRSVETPIFQQTPSFRGIADLTSQDHSAAAALQQGASSSNTMPAGAQQFSIRPEDAAYSSISGNVILHRNLGVYPQQEILWNPYVNDAAMYEHYSRSQEIATGSLNIGNMPSGSFQESLGLPFGIDPITFIAEKVKALLIQALEDHPEFDISDHHLNQLQLAAARHFRIVSKKCTFY